MHVVHTGEIMVLNFLDDEQFIQLTSGGTLAKIGLMNSLNFDFCLRCAEYIHFYKQISPSKPFK